MKTRYAIKYTMKKDYTISGYVWKRTKEGFRGTTCIDFAHFYWKQDAKAALLGFYNLGLFKKYDFEVVICKLDKGNKILEKQPGYIEITEKRGKN